MRERCCGRVAARAPPAAAPASGADRATAAASTKTSAFSATPTHTVARSPSAGSSTKPHTSVPPIAPAVLMA